MKRMNLDRKRKFLKRTVPACVVADAAVLSKQRQHTQRDAGPGMLPEAVVYKKGNGYIYFRLSLAQTQLA
jgi:hypothetical protein